MPQHKKKKTRGEILPQKRENERNAMSESKMIHTCWIL